MAELTARFDEDDVIRISGRLTEISGNMKDLRTAGAWAAASVVVSDETEGLFDRQGRVGAGPPWSRLAPSTVKQRERKNFTPIRVGWQTGRMAQSLIEPTHPQAIEIMTADTYTRGTAVNNQGHSYPLTFARGREGRQPARSIYRRLFGDQGVLDRLTAAIARRVFGGSDDR